MKGVHQKREEPPRWTPTLTPIQQGLRRRLSIYSTAYLASGFFVNLATNLLDPPSWVWWAVGALWLIAFAPLPMLLRELQKTGPPFDRLRWWWAWRFPRK
jgi:hypothetical protein